jgi:hypothetical protein
MDIISTPAQPVDGQHGTTDTAVLVRFQNGNTVPVGVQVGHCASEYIDIYNTHESVVVGVRRGGVTQDLLNTPQQLLGEAQRRLHTDAVLRYRAEVTAHVLKSLRTDDPKVLREDLEDDQLIAAIALVLAGIDLPGTPG